MSLLKGSRDCHQHRRCLVASPRLTTPRPSETTRSSVSSPWPCSSKESSRRSLNQRQTRRFPSPATTHRRDFRPPPTSPASVEVFISFLVRWSPFFLSSLSCLLAVRYRLILTELSSLSVRDTRRSSLSLPSPWASLHRASTVSFDPYQQQPLGEQPPRSIPFPCFFLLSRFVSDRVQARYRGHRQ
jgi:hypothetical protein